MCITCPPPPPPFLRINLCMHSCHSNPKVKRWGCLTLIPLLLYMVVVIIVRNSWFKALKLE